MSLTDNKYMKVVLKYLRIDLLVVYLTVVLAAGVVSYVLGANLIPSTDLFVNSLEYQSLVETFIYIFTFLMSIGGFYLLFRSVDTLQEKRESGMLFIGGLMLLLLSFIMIFGMWHLKLSQGA